MIETGRRIALLVALAALGSFTLLACGDDPESVSVGNEASPSTGAATSAEAPDEQIEADEQEVAAASKDCSEPADIPEGELAEIAELISGSPFESVIDTIEFRSAADAFDTSRELVVGQVESVRRVDLRPLNLLPGPGGTSNEHAGNSTYWSGFVIEVQGEGGSLEVQLPLAAGGEDVLRATPSGHWNLDALVGVCSLVTTGDLHGVPLIGGPRLVAFARSDEAKPVAASWQFAQVVEREGSLASIVVAADQG